MKKVLLVVLASAALGFQFLPSLSDEKPEDNRFTEVVLAKAFDEPMAMTFIPGNKILIAERKGTVKLVNEDTKEVSDAGWLEVNTKYVNREGRSREAEEGLMGITADPNFEKNHWVYLYYADPEVPKHILARWEMKDDALVEDSKKVLLEVKTQRYECCHTGGGMTWDQAGNLYLTVGNNTVNPRSGASNMNEEIDHEEEDDQRGPGNTNDLRGKILRIHPEANGTYSIPKGNLFPVGTPNTRPEIYTMGHRNPWRPSIDSKTGYLYWGEVGPDAGAAGPYGPTGYDEFNQAKKAGFFGWPYFIGNNEPYNKYNSADKTYGEPFDVNKVVNNSRNNTGLKDLPKPVPAFLWYPYAPSTEFPLLGSSGRSATGGPVYHRSDFKNAVRPWPAYYENKWLITEFMRGWIIAVTMDQNGDYVSMEKVLPQSNFSGAIDMQFGPSGDLYILEYGTTWFKGNENSRLVKIEYNDGNRKPQVAASSNVSSGKLPLKVNFSASGSMDYDDYDQGKLTYQWAINKGGKKIGELKGENPSYTFTQGGDYEVTLTVKDSRGGVNTTKLDITAGNEVPQIDIVLDKPNQTFYLGEKSIAYKVLIKDAEDGQIGKGIAKDAVAMTFDYLPQGFDPIEMASNQATADQIASLSAGRQLIEKSDCISCHQFNEKSIGPSYTAVAQKYPNNKENKSYLVEKIIKGGSGVWGEHGMSAHPDLSQTDASRMVDYILAYSGKDLVSIPLEGKLNPEIPEYELGRGGFVLRAAYKDKGAKGVRALKSEKIIELKNPSFRPHDADIKFNVDVLTAASNAFFVKGGGSYFGFKDIDLTELDSIVVYVQNNGRSGAKGGKAELMLGGANGKKIAVSNYYTPPQTTGFVRPPANLSPEQRRRWNMVSLVLPIPKDVKGKHDLYFKFVNPEAQSFDYVMQINEISFY